MLSHLGQDPFIIELLILCREVGLENDFHSNQDRRNHLTQLGCLFLSSPTSTPSTSISTALGWRP